MKLADLKRIAPGTRLRLVRSLMGPCDKPGVVARVQSNALTRLDDATGRESWLYFPKAADFQATDGGFAVLEDGEVAAEYRFD